MAKEKNQRVQNSNPDSQKKSTNLSKHEKKGYQPTDRLDTSNPPKKKK